ncbi:hypothetical protein RA307_31725 [Xanthobacteraceae bacterium Astr-EGSB]|uniref:hypothetical protein n=1 Tax=Astrobacterium formosum TaxID=3069710 RepID=UPI0027B05647|nr:hypothetical protein [Xanthobacteraceae bacterium Astr-EGSB]
METVPASARDPHEITSSEGRLPATKADLIDGLARCERALTRRFALLLIAMTSITISALFLHLWN